MKDKVAFLTTIFPMKEEYLTMFLNSLEKQTCQNFDLIIVNDGYIDFKILKDRFDKLNIIELEFSSTHAKNREYGINYVIEQKYDILIFGDSDDCFEKDRVEISLEKLLDYDIVVNDLSLFDGKNIFCKGYLSNRIENNTEIDLQFIKEKNIFGISNTAIKIGELDKIYFDKELIAIDWYFFSTLLIKGYKAVFTTDTETLYRQYAENIIGIGKLTKETLLNGISLKLRQYKLLINLDESYKYQYEEILQLKKEIEDKKIINLIIKQNIKFPLWWEIIKSIKE